MERLQIITHEEYVLSNMDLKIKKIQREREGMPDNNETNFLTDLANRHLDCYRDTYVIYKDGILCGQSRDRDSLLKTASYEFCQSNLSIFKVPKKGEKLEI